MAQIHLEWDIHRGGVYDLDTMLKAKIKYTTEKTIKYIRLYIIPINRVNDSIASTREITLTGPFIGERSFSEDLKLYWKGIEYWDISTLYIKIIVEYMDGTYEEFDDSSVSRILPPPPPPPQSHVTEDIVRWVINGLIVAGIIGFILLCVISNWDYLKTAFG